MWRKQWAWMLTLPLLLSGIFWFSPSCSREQRPLVIKRIDPAEAARLADETLAQVAPKVAEDFEISLWASDSLAPDPIALHVDQQGRVYITRTHRQKNSEFDIRGHRDWMTASITLQTVEDRRAFLKKTFSPEKSEANSWLPDLNGDSLHDWHDLAVEKEQIFRIEDTDGDGIADFSQLFIEDFHEEVTDVAGAVLTYEDELFIGVAPDVWRVQDTDGDGMADTKKSISHGYGVHVGFGGHGMSGLTMGPDGRVYWGIGDIGSNITAPDGTQWNNANRGAIFRANPDGSDFEVFAYGVRNTHEFVFDEYANLISVDNDGDHPGEQERLVYITHGSDTGWRINWQFGKYTDPDNNAYKVWMDEQMYKPRWEGQAAYITPPIANYHSGPTGMLYHTGTVLSPEYKKHFFIVEFTGSPARSHIYAFRLKPDGATFAFDGEKEIVNGVLATGIDFGPDGAIYAADWIDGWGTKNTGRIWKVDVTPGQRDPLRQETEALIRSDWGDKSTSALQGLLFHADQRIRQRAQFALAKAGDAGAAAFQAAIDQRDNQLARVHGIWGLSQMAREDLSRAAGLQALLTDADPEIRAQAAKWIGDVRYGAAAEAMLPLLKDDHARVRFFAAEALGRIAYKPAVQPIMDMLAANNDEDAYLRHAGACALARIGEADPIVALAKHPNRGLRIAGVVALRRLSHPGVAEFLNDPDEYIVTEAARAINDDHSIPEALPALARVLDDPRFSGEPLIRRAINANLRTGTAENLELLTRYATRTSAPPAMRAEAIATLGVWAQPSVLDRVTGRYRGPINRDPAPVAQATREIITPILADPASEVKISAAETSARLQLADAQGALTQLLRRDADPQVRIAALEALGELEGIDMQPVLDLALKDREKAVRTTALGLLPQLPLPGATISEYLSSILGAYTPEEQQRALTELGKLDVPEATQTLNQQLDLLMAGKLDPALQLELMEAVATHGDAALTQKLDSYQAQLAQQDPLGPYRDALQGGDPQEGRSVFFRNQSAQCARCHAVGNWGGDVGPPLTAIATVLNREQLLESLINPSARISPGYGVVSLTLNDDSQLAGTVVEESSQMLVLQTTDAEPVKIPKSNIKERKDAPSSMPPMGEILNKREIRDLVAYLSTLGQTS